MRHLLIIHFGDKMSDQRQRCIDSAYASYPDFAPQWITDENVNQPMHELLTYLELDIEPRAWDRATLMGRTLSSDWLRAWMLSTMSCTLYADTDVLHLRRFEFDDTSIQPYIIGRPAYSAMMYSAHACQYWRDLLAEKKRRRDWGNPQDAMSGDDGIPITREYFQHFGASENQHLADDKHWWMKG